MEWIEARGALKSSFFSEIAMVTTQQVCFDDVRGFANVTCEDFSVDDLLDFSDKDFKEGSFQESEEDEAKHSFSASSEERSFVNNNEFGAFPEGELAVPVDEMENLEWLSQFVDDSGTETSETSLLYRVENSKEKTDDYVKSRCEPVIRESNFSTPICRKPRGKRSRPSGRVVWALWLPSITSELSSTSSTSQGFSTDFPCVLMDRVHASDVFFSVEKPPTKKQKKKSSKETGSESQTLRRCTHCQVQKTPQWRTGPLGPKTLCNACGVRYKSGRLYPEYRPACSPTFSLEVHSNSHRKVLEMRQKKMGEVSETGSTPEVLNC